MLKHWSVDVSELKKDKNTYTIWQLEQRINFGVGDQKLNKNELVHYWSKLDLDPLKKKFLSFLLA